MPETPDFVITNHGTILHVRIGTEEALEWVGDNLEIDVSQVVWTHVIETPSGSVESFTFAADHRPGWGLVDRLEDSGRFLVDVRHPAALSA